MPGVLINDQMGLGKSPQSIAVHNYLAPKHNAKNPKRQFRTLTICPAQLRANWVRQWRKFSNIQPNQLVSTDANEPELISILAEDHPVTIIAYDTFSRTADRVKKDSTGKEIITSGKKVMEEFFIWPQFLAAADFDLIIVDESHYAKNMDANRTKALLAIADFQRKANKNARWIFLSGTPVLNRPGEFFPSLHISNPTLFPEYNRYLSQYTWDKKTARNVEELRELLKPIMIRRLTRDIRKELSEPEPIYEYTELKGRALQIYNKVLAGIWEDIETGQLMNITNFIAQITRLKQICTISKHDYIADKAIQIYDSHEKDDKHKKVLIFTQWVNSAYAIAKRLGDEALVITGEALPRVADRMKVVDEFQSNPKIHFLVCSTKAASEGLDMTEAGTVLFADLMWNPANHQQAYGRAFGRENDPHNIDLYYVIAENTIEEWIMDMIAAKQSIINEVVDGVEGSRDISVANELLKKMKEHMRTTNFSMKEK
jgi:SNF2 family DNA or RNA helicase